MNIIQMYPPQKDSPSTYITGDIGPDDTFIVVGSSEVLLKNVPFALTLGFDKSVTETVIVTEIGESGQLTVTRGAAPLSWVAGTKCATVWTADNVNAVQNNIKEVIAQTEANIIAVEANAENTSAIASNLTEEIERAAMADANHSQAIAGEITRAKNSEISIADQISSEITRATEAENKLQNEKVNRHELTVLITDVEYIANSTTVAVTFTTYDANAQEIGEFVRYLPIASNNAIGLMTPEAYNELIQLRADVLALQQQGGLFIGRSFATNADLDDYDIPDTVHKGDFTYILDDEEHSGATTKQVYDGTAFKFAIIVNFDPIGLANSSRAGLVLSDPGITGGKIFVNFDGSMSVIGWDSVLQSIAAKISANNSTISFKLNGEDVDHFTLNQSADKVISFTIEGGGGIQPSNMRLFKTKSAYSQGTDRIEIIADLPLDTVIDGQLLVTVAGAMIRRSTTNYPVNENDGDLVSNITEDTVLFDTNVVAGQTYYYAAFPYSTQNVYNRNISNRSSIEYFGYMYLYGYDLNVSDANPETRITYPQDVDNASFTSAAMNFTTGIFSYGGWSSTPGEKFMPRPCMLNYDGTVAYYLDPNDHSKKEDGTVSDIANTAFNGNAMMEWPKIYTKRELVGNIYKFRCSDIPHDNTWECWCNYDANNKVIDHFYTPIYFGSNVSSKLRSISGQANMISQTRQTEITYATANGNGWYTEVLSDRLLIQDLLVLMAKTTNCQTAYGNGVCGASAAIAQGTMNNRGLFWGSNDQVSGVKVFGMENWWGNIWRAIAGWINASGTQKVKLTQGNRDGSTAANYNLDGSGYLTLDSSAPAGSSGGYISSLLTQHYGRIPTVASGSSSTYEADALWFNNSRVNYTIVGGVWDYALRVGPFCVALDYVASYASAIGAALSCKPLAV